MSFYDEYNRNETKYEFEKILDDCTFGHVTYFLIQWKGNYPLQWQPIQNIPVESILQYHVSRYAHQKVEYKSECLCVLQKGPRKGEYCLNPSINLQPCIQHDYQ